MRDRRPVESARYRPIAFTERLAAAGVSGSVGTGDAYDNALAEPVIGLFKTELIKPRGPWRTAEQVEIATLEYVDWFNTGAYAVAAFHRTRVQQLVFQETLLPGLPPAGQPDPSLPADDGRTGWHFSFFGVPNLPGLLHRGFRSHP
jgi:hypothetical protein